MNVKKVLLTALAVGVVMNVFDFLVQGMLLSGWYSQFSILRKGPPPILWLVVGDFVAALVFVWVYDRVASAFAAGPKGGALFGLYAGVLVNFPTWIFAHLIIEGFTYGLAWGWTALGIVWGVVAGAVAGAVYKK
jgi:hypothetical protein